MLSSMTGFGRSESDSSLGKWVVEIQSINRKYLEVFVSLPKEMAYFETDVRKIVGKFLSRGQVVVRISLSSPAGSMDGFLSEKEALLRFKEGWVSLARALEVDEKEVNLSFLMQHFPAVSKQEVGKEDLKSLEKGIEEALKSLNAMRKEEGRAIAKDFSSRSQVLQNHLKEIEKSAPEATEKMKQRLFEKMQEAFEMTEEFEGRLLKEVALFAERVDVSEEILRFHSHLEQFRLALKQEVVGRKLDFLIQEMMREINTIGSKSLEAKISHLVVEMKSELEKIREQVQNIE